MKNVILSLSVILIVGISVGFSSYISDHNAGSEMTTSQKKTITVRTESFPRPPYSGATYYIYESEDKVICTKLEVCNKYDHCEKTYKKGIFKDEIDIETGDPYGTTDAVSIAPGKLKRHLCLTKFKLIP